MYFLFFFGWGFSRIEVVGSEGFIGREGFVKSGIRSISVSRCFGIGGFWVWFMGVIGAFREGVLLYFYFVNGDVKFRDGKRFI